MYYKGLKKDSKPCLHAFALSCFLLITSCASSPEKLVTTPENAIEKYPGANLAVEIPNLSHCSNSSDKTIYLNTNEPVTVIVHGCFSSAGRFAALADIFAFHNQQAICFNYDDRDRLSRSSEQLVTAIESLAGVLDNPKISVLGHSQGGLVARHAFTQERSDRLADGIADIRLVTISAPFGGIKIASHCDSMTMAVLSLGISKLVCQMVTGSKYHEIPPQSDFIRHPGTLIASIDTHLKISTDETDTCRKYNEQNKCVEDDFVFSVAEQTQQAIEKDTGFKSVLVKSGHVEIVGDGNTTPTQLINILQQYDFLNPTPPELSQNLTQLLNDLYMVPQVSVPESQ